MLAVLARKVVYTVFREDASFTEDTCVPFVHDTCIYLSGVVCA